MIFTCRPALSPYARELPSEEIAASRTVDPKLEVNWRSVMPADAAPERPTTHATAMAAGIKRATAAHRHHRRFGVGRGKATDRTLEAALRFNFCKSARNGGAL